MYFEDKTISVDTEYAASGVVVCVHVGQTKPCDQDRAEDINAM